MATETEQSPYDIQDPGEDGQAILAEAVEEQTNAGEGEQAQPSDQNADDHSGDEGDEPSQVVDDDAHDEVEQPEIPSALLQEAEELGFSQEEIQGFGPQQLEQVLRAFNRQLADRVRPTEHEQPKDPPKDLPKLELPEINLEDVDPEIAKYIEAQSKVIQDMHAQVHGLAGLQQQVQTLYAQEQQRQVEAFQGQFDGFIENLGETWGDVFGKKAQAADTAKQALMDEAFVLASGYEATGKPMPAVGDLLNRALRSLHGDRLQDLARKELNGKLKQRARQGIARPSNRRAQDMTPEERATRAVADKMAEKGWTDDESEPHTI